MELGRSQFPSSDGQVSLNGGGSDSFHGGGWIRFCDGKGKELLQYYREHECESGWPQDNLLIVDVDYSMIQSESGYPSVDQDRLDESENRWIFRSSEWVKYIHSFHREGYSLILLYNYILGEEKYLYRNNQEDVSFIFKTYGCQKMLKRINMIYRELLLSSSKNHSGQKDLSILFIEDPDNPRDWDLQQLLNGFRIIPSKNCVYIGRENKLMIKGQTYVKSFHMPFDENSIFFPYQYEAIIIVGQYSSGKSKLCRYLNTLRGYKILDSRHDEFNSLLVNNLKQKNNIIINGIHPSISKRKEIISILNDHRFPFRIFHLTIPSKHINYSTLKYHDEFQPPTAFEGGFIIKIDNIS